MALRDVEFHCIQEYPDDSLLSDFILFMVQALTDIEREKVLDTLLTEPEH
jgi:hypothetical protein